MVGTASIRAVPTKKTKKRAGGPKSSMTKQQTCKLHGTLEVVHQIFEKTLFDDCSQKKTTKKHSQARHHSNDEEKNWQP
jgi:hypothetical protein